MLGPEGNGVLYVRKDHIRSNRARRIRLETAAGYADYSSRDMAPRPDAGRYEASTLNTIGCFGQRAAIEFRLETGIDRIR